MTELKSEQIYSSVSAAGFTFVPENFLWGFQFALSIIKAKARKNIFALMSIWSKIGCWSAKYPVSNLDFAAENTRLYSIILSVPSLMAAIIRTKFKASKSRISLGGYIIRDLNRFIWYPQCRKENLALCKGNKVHVFRGNVVI